MICKNCKRAGEFNWLLNTNTAGAALGDELRKRAEMHHSECPGGTHCDCQHRIGKCLETTFD